MHGPTNELCDALQKLDQSGLHFGSVSPAEKVSVNGHFQAS